MQICGNESLALEEVDAILSKVDADGSGTIDYTGRLVCTRIYIGRVYSTVYR